MPIYNWERDFGLSPARILDTITGKEIRVVIWVDTETNTLERYELDENGQMILDENNDPKRIQENRIVDIEFLIDSVTDNG